MVNIDNANGKSEKMSMADTKQLLRKHIKNWHPDRGRAASESLEGMAVMNILTALGPKTDEDGNQIRGLDDISWWPNELEFASGKKLALRVRNKTLFLPSTPREFFELLDLLEGNHPLPEKFFRPADIRKRGRREYSDDDVDYSDDDLLERFKQVVDSAETLNDLVDTTETSKLFGHSQLLSTGYYTSFNARALFLFTRAAYKLESREELGELIEKVKQFEFKKAINNVNDSIRFQALAAINTRIEELEKIGFQPPKRTGLPVSPEQQKLLQQRAMDKGARLHFIEQVRNAQTIDELEALAKNIGKFPFLNRGELGVVRSALSRKIAKLKSIDES